MKLKIRRQSVDFSPQRVAVAVEEAGRLDPRIEIAEAALGGAKGNLNVDAKRLHAHWQ
jgi:hypothetical protein